MISLSLYNTTLHTHTLHSTHTHIHTLVYLGCTVRRRGFDDTVLVGIGDSGEGGRERGREEGTREVEDEESMMVMVPLWLMALTPGVRYSG